MSGLTPCTPAQLRHWLEPYDPHIADDLLLRLLTYLELLQRWNAKTNLTALRSPQEVATRHFGESLFAARHVPANACTLLDVGSGAGFPGLPIALARPELRVTLAESQGKKSAFLREAVRTLGVRGEVWAARLEELPPARLFSVVTLRAVDRTAKALALARTRLEAGGTLLHLTSRDEGAATGEVPMPQSATRVLRVERGVS